MTIHDTRRQPSRLLVLGATYLLTRVLFWAAGFRYDLLSGALDARRLAIDFGTWLAVYAFVLWAFRGWASAARLRRAG